HAEHASPFGLGQLVEGHAVEDARIAHDRVEATEGVDRGTNDRFAALGARHGFVRRNRQPARALDLGDDLVGDAGVRALAVHGASELVHHHRPTAPRNLHRKEAAETPASSSDDNDLARKVYHAVPRAPSTYYPSMIMPPSTTKTCPVIMSLSSEARNTAVPVRSCGWRARFNALNIGSMVIISSGTIRFAASVSVRPGQMALTLMPHGPKEPAMYLVSPETPI